MSASISVIVPTYLRTHDLERCLQAFSIQTRSADEIIVVVRESDRATLELLAEERWGTLKINVVKVIVPGVVAAMNAGLAVAQGDVIALTDDDAAPWRDWLARIEAHFTMDPQLGGVGGRDWQYKGGHLDDGRSIDAGEMSWFGRVKAGHHWAVGGPRDVVVLKGVNCAYRAQPLRKIGFDQRMAGTGAQVHWELSLGLTMRREGWKLLFDPAMGVDHFPAQRFDEDQRSQFNALAQRNAVANETLVLFEHLHAARRLTFLAWAGLIGTRAAPGLAQVPRLLCRGERNVIRRWWATLQGRLAGLHSYWSFRALSATR
jgi:GT2 family glycosyltransferase